MRTYIFARRVLIFLTIVFITPLILMIFFGPEPSHRLGGGVGIALVAGIVWIAKGPIVKTDDTGIVFWPNFQKSSKRIEWQDILGVYTIKEGRMGTNQYIVPKKRTGNWTKDEEINKEITQQNKNKKTIHYLRALAAQRMIYRIPRVKNYRELLIEICKMSAGAVVDEETHRILEGKSRAANILFR